MATSSTILDDSSEEISKIEIKSKSGKMKVYLKKAIELLQMETSRSIVSEHGGTRRIKLIGRGECVYRAISIAELLKRTLSGISLSSTLLAENIPGQLLPKTSIIILIIRSPVSSVDDENVTSSMQTKRTVLSVPLESKTIHPKNRHGRRKLQSHFI